jgi:hypothetical protein
MASTVDGIGPSVTLGVVNSPQWSDAIVHICYRSFKWWRQTIAHPLRRPVGRPARTGSSNDIALSTNQRQNPCTQRVSALRATDESACTPGSVPRCRSTRAAAIHLGLPSPAGSSGLPAGSGGPPSIACADPARGRRSSWPCSGWGLPSHPGHPGCWWALTPPFHPYRRGRGRGGGLFSVALSRGSPRVAVNNHPALWSPDVPRRRATVSRSSPTRPPGRLVRRTNHATSRGRR